jgi:hypothetical protein
VRFSASLDGAATVAEASHSSFRKHIQKMSLNGYATFLTLFDVARAKVSHRTASRSEDQHPLADNKKGSRHIEGGTGETSKRTFSSKEKSQNQGGSGAAFRGGGGGGGGVDGDDNANDNVDVDVDVDVSIGADANGGAGDGAGPGRAGPGCAAIFICSLCSGLGFRRAEKSSGVVLPRRFED